MREPSEDSEELYKAVGVPRPPKPNVKDTVICLYIPYNEDYLHDLCYHMVYRVPVFPSRWLRGKTALGFGMMPKNQVAAIERGPCLIHWYADWSSVDEPNPAGHT
jgi:hypothetical protein